MFQISAYKKSLCNSLLTLTVQLLNGKMLLFIELAQG